MMRISPAIAHLSLEVLITPHIISQYINIILLKVDKQTGEWGMGNGEWGMGNGE
jgi:hypothetical protein